MERGPEEAPDPQAGKRIDAGRSARGGRDDRAARGDSASPAHPDDPEPPESRLAILEAWLGDGRLRGREAELVCELLSRVLESISDAFVALDAHWRYIYVNADAGRLLGREPASLIGKHIWTEFPEGIGQPFQEAYERAMAEGKPQHIEEYYPPYDRWFENRIYPCAGGLAIFFQDVTERKLTDLRLRRIEARYRALVEQSIVGVFVIDHGRYAYVNPCFEDMLGHDAEALYALPSVLHLVHPDDRRFIADRMRRRLAGESPPPSRFRMIRGDGAVIHVEAHSRSVTLDGRVVLIGVQIDITDEANAEIDLRRSEARFRSMIEHSSDAITIVDAQGIVRFGSPSTQRIFGVDVSQQPGHSVFASVHPDDSRRIATAFRELLAKPGQTASAEFRVRHAQGTWRHVAAIAQNLLDDPAVRGIIVNTRDITERVEVEEALRESEDRFRTLVVKSPDAVVLHSEGRILYANPAAAELVGASDPRELIGAAIADFVHGEPLPPERERLEALVRGEAWPGMAPYRLVRLDDGRIIDVEISSAPTTLRGRPAVQSHVRDVTARVALEAQLLHQAFHDPLTGLANRALFRDRAEHALSRTGRGEHVAVVLLDIDDFKRVNDSLGHAAGDELLQLVARRLLEAARGSDTVARLGGDEFALLLETLSRDEDVSTVLERVAATIRQPVTIASHEVAVSASIGVAHPRDGEGADELLRNADVAMYRAKAGGKGRFEIFAPEMHAAAVERLQLEADLRVGLARDELRLAYQPLVDLATRQIVGAEALVRWQHPTRGVMHPLSFIPVAEQTGLIVPLGRWVLNEACQRARSWEPVAGAQGTPAPWVSVNISGRQLQESTFTADVAAALERSALPPARLVLEITESVLLQDAEAALAKLLELKALGVRLALDDFGTGYSSLAYLQRFPFDVLKMDRSFTEELGGETAEPALPRAIVALGRSLGMQTVAEGIETTAQFGRLGQLGCDIGQGFLFAAPIGAAEFLELLGDAATGDALA